MRKQTIIARFDRQLPCLRDYQAADHFYRRTETIRGKVKDYYGVPLRKDRRNHEVMRLRKHANAFAARLYATDVVVWHDDDTISVDITYNSQTTRRFAAPLLPYGITSYLRDGKPIIQDPFGEYVAAYGVIKLIPYEYFVPTSPNALHRYKVDRDTVPTMEVRRLDRKVAAAVRRELKPLFAYLRTMQSLGSVPYSTWEEMAALSGDTPNGWVVPRHVPSSAFTDPELFPAVAAACMMTTREWSNGEFVLTCRVSTKQVEVLREEAYRRAGAYYLEPVPCGLFRPKSELRV